MPHSEFTTLLCGGSILRKHCCDLAQAEHPLLASMHPPVQLLAGTDNAQGLLLLTERPHSIEPAALLYHNGLKHTWILRAAAACFSFKTCIAS